MKKKLYYIFILIFFILVINTKADNLDNSDYINLINELKTFHPNWQFKLFNTDIDFNEAVIEENKNNKNLVPIDSDYSLKSKNSGDYNINTNTFIEKDRKWVNANKLVISYFMNPLNFLNEKHIMQFELLGYDSDLQNIEGVEDILKDTFMYQNKITYLDSNGEIIETNKTYSDVIMEAASISKVSPYYLASKIRQEIGINGNGSVSGNYKEYLGIYNFYNIGATDGENAISNALIWASSDTTYNRPWTSPEKSIIGGALYISEAYIKHGQNIGYLQKFNVNKDSSYPLYTHQYMTNVAGATSEAAKQFNSAMSLNNLYDLKTFYIPVYNNMPDMNTSITLNKEIDKQTGTINYDKVNLRDGPGISYNSILKLDKNDKVTIISGYRTNTIYDINFLYYPYWYLIGINKNGKNYTGYINSKYINIDSSKIVYIGDTYKLDYKINSSKNELIYFESTNMKVATIDDDGIISFKSPGYVTINVYVGSRLESISFEVRNRIILANSISLNNNNITLNVGENKIINYNIMPSNITNKEIIWTSSNNNIASISNGIISAKNPGKTTITASIDGKKANCNVNVNLPKTTITSIYSNSHNSIKINYNKINDITGYYIYRSNSLSGTYNYIGYTKNNYYINSNLTTNQKYYYKIKTYKIINGKKYTSDYSNIRYSSPILPNPNIILSKYGKNKVKITYQKITGASGYQIYRSNSKNGKYSLIKTTSNKSFINSIKLKRTYYYKVRAYKIINKKRIYSGYSNIKSIKR